MSSPSVHQSLKVAYGDGWEDGTNTLIRRMKSDDIRLAVATCLHSRQPHNVAYDWDDEARDVIDALITALDEKGVGE